MVRLPLPSEENVREFIAGTVRQRIVGPDAERRHDELFTARGPRWFAPERPIRTVHADTAMFIGGLRALLLQSLHPLAMAGVADHSDYRGDPWGRLQRTADFLAATTFGPSAEAERAIAAVRRIHEHVRGTAPDGRPYSAGDPHLLRWVHVAEVDSFLRAHQRYGARPLDSTQRDGYVADMARIAHALGVPAPPTSERGLADQLRSFRPETRVTPAAREVARFLVLEPPLPFAARPVYGVLVAAAVGLLPRWARRSLLLPAPPVVDAAVVRPAATALVKTMRWALGPLDDSGHPPRVAEQRQDSSTRLS
jgi:uncharacterized protein (DUF2236 family)